MESYDMFKSLSTTQTRWGVDVGTNSAALVVNENNVLSGRLVIYKDALQNQGDTNEKSKASERREYRSKRRMNRRKVNRKFTLADELMKIGAFPQISGGLSKHIRKTVLPDDLRNYFTMDPYTLRAKGVDEKLTLLELGRVLYHMAQRRGYKENLIVEKGDVDGDTSAQEKKKMFKGKANPMGVDIVGISETRKLIDKYGTLGKALYNLDSQEYNIRRRYTTRQMYIDEFNVIWNKQKEYYSDILTDELRDTIGDPDTGILFSQRPLKSQKHLLGSCAFDKAKSRTPRCSMLFEEYRMWNFLNNVKVDNKKLTDDKKNKLKEFFLNTTGKVKFKEIRKYLGLEGDFNYKDTQSITCCNTIAWFRNIYGVDVWEKMSSEEQKDVWDAKYFASDREWLEKYCINVLNLTPEQTEQFVDFNIDRDYSSMSERAIKKILPFLKEGNIEYYSIIYGGVANVFGHDWTYKSDEEKIYICNYVRGIIKEESNENRAMTMVKEFLMREYQFTKKHLNSKLYHPNIDVQYSDVKLNRLPIGVKFTNPIVQKSVNKIFNMLNDEINHSGKENVTLTVELSRELKASKEERLKINLMNIYNEEVNDNAKEILVDNKIKITRDNIERVKLWLEQEKTCLYTGNKITLDELFDGVSTDVDHIVPYSIKFEDGFNNKIVTFKGINSDKGTTTPYQRYGDSDEWKDMKKRAESILLRSIKIKGKTYQLNPSKYRKFVNKDNPEKEGFLDRHLNDNRFVSIAVKSEAEKVFGVGYVNTVKGKITALLRYCWDLNSVLYELPENDDNLKKNRDDHRHHLIDAAIIATYEPEHLQMIAEMKEEGLSDAEMKGRIPLPWKNFREDVKKLVASTEVKHEAKNKSSYNSKQKLYTATGKKVKDKYNDEDIYSQGKSARGALHDETFFGKHYDTTTKKYGYYTNKPLSWFNSKSRVEKIVDVGVKRQMLQFLEANGVDVNKSSYSFNANSMFYSIDDNKFKRTKLFLPNSNGKDIPIKSIRCKFNKAKAKQLYKDRNIHVNPNSNYQAEIFIDAERKKLKDRITPFMDAAQKNSGNDIFKGYKRVATLRKDAMCVLNLTDEEYKKIRNNKEELSKHMYRVQKISEKNYVFIHHTVSGVNDVPKDKQIVISGYKRWVKYNPIML